MHYPGEQTEGCLSLFDWGHLLEYCFHNLVKTPHKESLTLNFSSSRKNKLTKISMANKSIGVITGPDVPFTKTKRGVGVNQNTVFL